MKMSFRCGRNKSPRECESTLPGDMVRYYRELPLHATLSITLAPCKSMREGGLYSRGTCIPFTPAMYHPRCQVPVPGSEVLRDYSVIQIVILLCTLYPHYVMDEYILCLEYQNGPLE